tara:strand:+ start:4674 stop:5537 length:864 start_codon:yes stop_codon:yes gene_type:complete
MYSHKKELIFILPLLFLFLSCDDSPTQAERVVPPTEEIIPDEEKEWQLVWEDEFDAEQLDMEKWSFQFGTGSEEGLTNWGNNEQQYYTDREENLFLEDGYLHIVAKEESYEGQQYTSARIRTRDKGDWMYGRTEIRAKLPQGQGIWPAIWMLPSKDNFQWPRDGEIDITELVGHEPERVHSTVHFEENDGDHDYMGTSYTLQEGIFADDFHTFSIEWKLNEIQFFVDENHFYTVNSSSLAPHNYPFNNTFHLIMNIAVGGNWPGYPDNTTQFPQSMIMDYVKVYQLQ